jgi:hypothetical protein
VPLGVIAWHLINNPRTRFTDLGSDHHQLIEARLAE